MSAAANKTAVITGASMGIGRAVAEKFVRAGYNLMLCARTVGPLEQAAGELCVLVNTGQKVLWKICDVSDEAQVAELARHVGQELGGCDVLINNAGVLGPIGPFELLDWAEWKRTIEIDLHGVALPCRAFIPQMKKKGRGKIINLSGGGATGSRPNFSAYAAAKTAVVRLTEVLADELSPFHIDVNAVAPGALKTRVTTEVIKVGAEKTGAVAHAEAFRLEQNGESHMELATALCLFLAGTECDGISGRLISARWDDWKLLPAQKVELMQGDLYTLRRIVPTEKKSS